MRFENMLAREHRRWIKKGLFTGMLKFIRR